MTEHVATTWLDSESVVNATCSCGWTVARELVDELPADITVRLVNVSIVADLHAALASRIDRLIVELNGPDFDVSVLRKVVES